MGTLVVIRHARKWKRQKMMKSSFKKEAVWCLLFSKWENPRSQETLLHS